MKEERKSKLKQIWNDKRGKDLLKLGGWFLFLIIVSILFATMGSKTGEKNTHELNSNETIKDEWKDFNVMLNDLETKDYRYEYQVIKSETKEITTYTGEKQNGIDTGYRESKIGIIKYKIQDDVTYQVLMDQEEPMDSLYEEDDIPYMIISNIKEMIATMPKDEIKNESNRIITYQDEEKKVAFETNEKNIMKIQIITDIKEYTLNYKF